MQAPDQLKLEEHKNQTKGGFDPWLSSNNPTPTTATPYNNNNHHHHQIHYLLQSKDDHNQIYHDNQEEPHQDNNHVHLQPRRSRGGGSTTTGEMIELAGGGRIVRSAAGRKDRHSKVCTARGVRDRRVRLAAHTAIQFYDVQDRLGYDRPSKAVDWLIRNSKAAIDDLPLPLRSDNNNISCSNNNNNIKPAISDTPAQLTTCAATTSSYNFGNLIGRTAEFLNSHNLDTDAAANTIKSFLPNSSASSCAPVPDLLSQNSSSHAAQELRLTLQSSHQDPIFNNHHHQGVNAEAAAFGANAAISGWYEQNQRMAISWNVAESSTGDGGSGGGGGVSRDGYIFSNNMPSHMGLDQSGQFVVSQGTSLQSSTSSPSVRGWFDQVALQHSMIHHRSLSSTAAPVGFAAFGGGGGSGSGGFFGFHHHMPQPHISGNEEHDNQVDKRQ